MESKEEWRILERYEGKYLVSNLGRVYNTKMQFVKKPQSNGTDYVAAYLTTPDGVYKCEMVHRLVAEAFIPNPNKYPTVNHKDGDKKNNHVDNLEWMTYLQNRHHAMEMGLWDVRGEKHPLAKLKEEDVRTIRTMIGKEKLNDIAIHFGVSKMTILNIKNGKTWRHVI